MSDDLAAALAEIRERYAARPGDVERLLAAIEAVLNLADSARGVHWGGRYLGWDLDPAKVREAIAAALAAGGVGDG